MTTYYGNHVVGILRTVIENGWQKTILDTPSFIIGGVAGQAMSANDVVTTVLEMFGIPSSASLFVNGMLTVDNGSTEGIHRDMVSVWLQPAEDCGH